MLQFKFDVHNFIFSENAVELEKTLHKRLNDKRVNKVNLRKEFFYSTVDELEELVNELDPTAVFNKTMLAEEYNQTTSVSADKYVIEYYLDGRPLKSLQASYGAELVKFDFIISAEANKGWMKKKPLSSRLDASFNFIEYTAY